MRPQKIRYSFHPYQANSPEVLPVLLAISSLFSTAILKASRKFLLPAQLLFRNHLNTNTDELEKRKSVLNIVQHHSGIDS